jgi:ribonuclease HI
MVKSTSSDDFTYGKTDYIIKSDASYKECVSRASAGWTLKSYDTGLSVVEGRCEVYDTETTVQTECRSILFALEDAGNRGAECVRVKTDLQQIITQIHNSEENEDIMQVKNALDNFECWSIEYTERQKLSRPHNLAISVFDE